ncbi:SDR family NAD(P)-dependent oxidoreductase [Actinomadura sp. LOL_016]|uniref:SDR family NAD(P)-dependent oxidoreductase n=1 Tax=unclassified Actinomadura TaxID=2626254 RepID=UPI003A80DD69
MGRASAERLAELGMTVLLGARDARRGEEARSAAPRIVNVGSHAGSPTLTSDPDGPFAALLPSAAYTPSKATLNALTVQYANELRKDGVLVNTVAPGFVDTDSNGRTGHLTPAEGAAVVVRLATLGADGPTAGFFGADGPLPW